jgi:hypothetical protein
MLDNFCLRVAIFVYFGQRSAREQPIGTTTAKKPPQ